jgi:signal transduction histidine kinase
LKLKALHTAILILLLIPARCAANKTSDSLLSVAIGFFEKGDYDKLLEYSIAALNILEEGGSCEEKANAYLIVGRAYYYLQQKGQSLRYMHIASNLAQKCKIDSIESTTARQMGAIYFELGKTDSAVLHLNKAERMLNQTNNWRDLASLYCILGEVYYHNIKDTVKAGHYFAQAEQYALKSGHNITIAFAYIKQGVFTTNKGNCKKGESYLKKALALYQKENLLEGVLYAKKMLASTYSECGKAKESYLELSQYQAIRDSIFKAETAENTAKFRTLYETEKKEKQNAELAKANALKELAIVQEVKAKRTLAMVFIVSTLALLAIFTVFWSRDKIRKQKELDEYLAQQQQERFEAVIKAEEDERKRIASDLHDGVGQIMSAAKINLSVLGNDIPFSTDTQRSAYEKIVALVDESCREVRSVSHNMMPNVLLKSGLANAIRAFIGQIDGKAIKVDFYSEGLDGKIDANVEVVLYRVLQECVNNVIKHSKASHLDITLIKDADGISATIEDNGRGFDTTNKTNFEGIGLKNITSRIAYLNGTVEWNSSPGKGTVVAIHIPVTS